MQPDGFAAQICAIDRLACVAYKKALDKVIAESLVSTEGLSEDEVEISCRSKLLVAVPEGLESIGRLAGIKTAFDVWLRERDLRFWQ